MEELVKNILVPQYGAEDDIRNLALVEQHQIEQEGAESEIDRSRQSLTPSQKRTPNRIPTPSPTAERGLRPVDQPVQASRTARMGAWGRRPDPTLAHPHQEEVGAWRRPYSFDMTRATCDAPCLPDRRSHAS